MAPPWQTELERARQAASLADWSAFQEEIDRLLARWGNHSDALLDASALLLPLGELSQAEALLQWCHQLEPQAPAPLQNLANTWLQSLRQQQAMQLYTNLAEHQAQAAGAAGLSIGHRNQRLVIPLIPGPSKRQQQEASPLEAHQ